MRRKLLSPFAALGLLLATSSSALADIRIVTRYTYGNTVTEKTTYLNGVRQREEFKETRSDGKTFDIAHIYQCDLKRFLFLDNLNHRYFDTPYMSMEDAWAAYYEKQREAKANPGAPAPQYKGVWTETTTIVDTGERREVFGFTARRIKTMTVSEAIPQSCNQTRLRQETDGWYIDLLYSTECSSDLSGYPNVSYYALAGSNSCVKFYEKRKYRFERKQIGTARFGFPITLVMRAYSNDGRTVSETRREVLEITKVELEESLFELPPGYSRIEEQPLKRSLLERALSLFR